MLEFICGAAGSGKTDEVYRRAMADAALGKSVYILVPEQYSMYAEQELLSRLGFSAQNKIQILTFSRLSNLIFSKLGPLRSRYIDKAGKHLMACRAIQLSSKELTVFSGSASKPGFAKVIVSAISEFKRYGISPSSLKSAAEKIDDAMLRLKLLDLAVIYKKFDELVSKEYSNAEDSLSVAVPKIPECEFLSGSVYVNFFRSFTPIEYKALEELMKICDLCIVLCTNTLSEKSMVFSSQVATIKKLSSMADSLGIKKQAPVFLAEKNDEIPSDLKFLRENYFSYKAAPFSKEPESIFISRPGNFYNEVHQCAQTICRLCRTEGYSFNDFLILTGDIKNYELILPSIFEEYNIKFFLDKKIQLTESPLLGMLTAVLEISAYGFSYERIMTIIRSGFWEISLDEADIFENYILAANPSHAAWNSPNPWDFNPDRHTFDMDTINLIKEKTVNKIQKYMGLFSGKKTIGDICQNFCDWLNTLDIHMTVSKKIDRFRESGQIERSEQLYRVWNSFVSVINQISQCMPDVPATFTDFFELFSATCGELSVGMVPPTRDKVLISEIDHFRSTGAKVVMVLGAVDKIFPGSAPAEGIISDSDRTRLCEIGLTLAPDAFNRQKENLFLIYSVLTTATEKLFLFSPISDRDGKSLGSSEITNRISKQLFPLLKTTTEVPEIDQIEGKEHTFVELSARLFEADWDISRLNPLWQKVYEYFERDASFNKRLKDLESMHRRRNIKNEISKQTAKKLYGEPLVLSVSKLERYNSCAFSFFMQYGLFAKERLVGGLKATDTGTLLHSVLCDYFKANKDSDFSQIERSTCFEDISRLVDNASASDDSSALRQSNFYSYMMLRIKNIAASTAWKLVKFYENSDFRPSGFEVSFGRSKELPPYKIESENNEVFLEGFIDKIDSANIDGTQYLCITDYKSSEKGFDSRLIDAGITIQPLLYANAVTKNAENAETAGVMYMQMTDPLLKFNQIPQDDQWDAAMNGEIKNHGIFLDDPKVINGLDKNADDKNAIHYVNCDTKSRLAKEIFDQKFKDAEKRASETANNICEGIIEPNPPKIPGFDPCIYCPFGDICRED